MPWRFDGPAGDTNKIICTGGCRHGFLPCPVDHANQPPNGEWQGETFFRCFECDWVIPDPEGENNYETAGMVTCPECCAGDRNDTYEGPCEWCNKLNVGARYRAHEGLIARHRAATLPKHLRSRSEYACPRCWHRITLEALREAETWLTKLEEDKAEQARLKRIIEERHAAEVAYMQTHPVGTCDTCGCRRELVICEPPLDLFVCVLCGPGDLPATAPLATRGPMPGWYPDPEFGDQYARYWTGQRWQGEPTLRIELHRT